ncbi:MAG: hypothetical protein Q8R37_05780, partial [Nanoarchaeota archaeon]|nr:hypothetical protein [Nanoarchaeota archaeon]
TMPFPLATQHWAEEMKTKLVQYLTVKQHSNLESMVSSSIMRDDSISRKAAEFVSSALQAQNIRKSKKEVAESLYYGLCYGYGFSEALETDNWTPWPEECTKANCYGQSIINYAVAAVCGLNPTIVEFIGLQREGDTQRAGHSLVVVDVGDDKPELWTIDQPQRMYGPITIDSNSFSIVNLDSTKEKTQRNDYQNKKFTFLAKIVNTEEDIISNVKTLRENPEAVLYPGQRIAILYADQWQSEKPLEAPWFIKFIPHQSDGHRGEIISRIIINRPGIKSRGLEYRITIGNDDAIITERISGYYCKSMEWAEFTHPIPMIDLSLERIKTLVPIAAGIPLDKRQQFELELMNHTRSCSEKYNELIAAAKESWAELQQSDAAEMVTAFATVEALYQQEKLGRETYLTSPERSREIERLKNAHPLLTWYAKDIKDMKRDKKIINKQAQSKMERLRLLTQAQREDPRIVAYMTIDSEQEMLNHVLKYKPTFVTDAIDRVIFYERRIKGREDSVSAMAEDTFGASYNHKVFGGYSRIFAEFLGHITMTLPDLSLQKYKQKIITKITR